MPWRPLEVGCIIESGYCVSVFGCSRIVVLSGAQRRSSGIVQLRRILILTRSGDDKPARRGWGPTNNRYRSCAVFLRILVEIGKEGGKAGTLDEVVRWQRFRPAWDACLPQSRGWCPIDVLIVARLGASHLLRYSEHARDGYEGATSPSSLSLLERFATLLIPSMSSVCTENGSCGHSEDVWEITLLVFIMILTGMEFRGGRLQRCFWLCGWLSFECFFTQCLLNSNDFSIQGFQYHYTQRFVKTALSGCQ